MKICLLDNTNFEYSLNDRQSNKLRGAETILINLYQQLINLKHNVYVFPVVVVFAFPQLMELEIGTKKHITVLKEKKMTSILLI